MLLARLLRKVTEGPECHVHSGSLGSHGYPQATGMNGRSGPAHRVRWELERGPIPTELVVRHTCNNKLCVNFAHLSLGTHRDNMDDMSRAGHPNRKLSAEEVVQARTLPGSQAHVGRLLGVSQKTIWQIRHGVNYRHVGPLGRKP